MEQGFHNGNHYKLYCLLGLVHLHWKKRTKLYCSFCFVDDYLKGCSHDTIATAIFLLQQMSCVGIQCKCADGAIRSMAMSLNPMQPISCDK